MSKSGPIPEELHSLETSQAFDRCFDCKIELLAPPRGYQIHKSYVNGEAIFEIAICTDCSLQLQESFSPASREAIANFYLDHADLAKRAAEVETNSTADLNGWIESCVCCNKARSDTREHTIAAQCFGSHLEYNLTPIMMCGECQEQLNSLLSPETRGEYDDWLDRCLPMAPNQDEPAPRARRPVFI